MKKIRIAVIGAGTCGLSQLIAFKSASQSDGIIPEIVCFEKQSELGGLWLYDWRTGVDQNGEPCHGSMYRYLWSNGPKEGLEFANYSFEEHFGKQIASYPPRAVLFDYIKGRAQKYNVCEWIRFNTVVRWIDFDENTQMFTITVHDYQKDNSYSESFDYLVVACGHFSTPNVPYYKGFETFNGRILHAHDFRDAGEFKDLDILILGTSYSAEDIGSQCWKYGCRSVTVAHRTVPMGFNWPDNWKEVPALVKIVGKTAHFKDKTRKEVDAVILCTGYKHHFPFLPDNLRLRTTNRLATTDLYKGVVWINNTKVFYLGMQDQWFTFNMFDAQAWWVRDAISGKIIIPKDKTILQEDVASRVASEEVSADGKYCIRYQGDYVQELLDETDCPSFDVDKTCDAFYAWKNHKSENIISFRDNAYKSVMTGSTAPLHHTPWVDALDDSMASYLKN